MADQEPFQDSASFHTDRLEYLQNTAKALHSEQPSLSCHLNLEALNLALSENFSMHLISLPFGFTTLALPKSFYENACTHCGRIFLSGETCTAKIWPWKRWKLSSIGKDKNTVYSSRYIKRKGKVKGDEDGTRYVLAFKCSNCQVHTVFDSYMYKEKRNAKSKSFPSPISVQMVIEKATTPSASVVIEEAKKSVVQEKKKADGLAKFMQKKAKQAQASSSSIGDLNSFLMSLDGNNKTKK